jgi:dsDNA-specific endonuclease/ATPase MutS2
MIIDNNKINKLVELQQRINREIDVYGKADESTVNEMMEIANNLNEAEQDEFIELSLGIY